MKKLIFALFAVAFINRVADSYHNTDGTYQITFDVAYIGADVDDGFINTPVTVSIGTSTSLAQLSSTVATQIRADAVNRGFTVPAGKVLMPSYSGL